MMSAQLFGLAWRMAYGPTERVLHIQTPWLRVVGWCVAVPLGCLGVVFGLPFLLAGALVYLWEGKR